MDNFQRDRRKLGNGGLANTKRLLEAAGNALTNALLEPPYEPGDPEKLYEQLRDLIHEHGSETVRVAFENVTS